MDENPYKAPQASTLPSKAEPGEIPPLAVFLAAVAAIGLSALVYVVGSLLR